MFDGIHSSIGNLDRFIKGDKRRLKKYMPDHNQLSGALLQQTHADLKY